MSFPETEYGQRVGVKALGRFICDSLLQAVFLSPAGAILDLGREVRTASRAQRRALVARDRGCVIPGCSAPASHCDAHHIVWVRHGGRSDISNFALLCNRHHTEVHQGLWDLIAIGGVPWSRPPTWIDPQRRLIRNTFHESSAEARELGTQLQLLLYDGTDDIDRWWDPTAAPAPHPWAKAEPDSSPGEDNGGDHKSD